MDEAKRLRIEYKLLHEDAKLPTRANTHDAASDLYSIEELDIGPGETASIHTGLAFATPPGYYSTINGRSSLSKHGLIPFRGIIDAGYVGELIVTMTNTGKSTYSIHKGDRIAQLIIHKVLEYEPAAVAEFSDEYKTRGTNGFGSSGR